MQPTEHAKESISNRVIRNSIYNSASFVWPIVVAFFTIPIIVKSLGAIDYGYYIFVGTLLSLFGLIDLGVSTAITKFFSEKIGENDEDSLKKYIGVAKFIFLSIGIIGLIILLLGSLSSLFLFNQTYAFLAPTILISAIIFFFSSIQSIVSTSFHATQRFDIASKIGIAIITIQQLSLAAVAYLTKDINLMFTTQLIVGILSFAIGYFILIKTFPIIKQRIIFDWSLIKKFYTYGTKTFLVGFSNSLLTYFDRLIIPIILGPKSLTYYTVPGTISTKIPGFANNIGSIVFSMASNFQGAKDDRRQKILYEKSSRIIILISTSLAISTIIFAREILGYWIDFDIADNSYLILIILSITSIFLAIFNILQNILLGTGKFKELAITTISMLIINLAGLFILLPLIGVLGAAIAYLISVLPVFILKLYVDKKYFNIELFYKERFVRALKLFFIIGVTVLTGFFVKDYIESLIAVIIAFGITNLVFIGISYTIKLIEKEEVTAFKKYVFKK